MIQGYSFAKQVNKDINNTSILVGYKTKICEHKHQFGDFQREGRVRIKGA